MGRKIKGKKHHGTKDPEKQQKARNEKIKMKINNRPNKEDFQDIPKSLKNLMRAQEEVKAGAYNPFPHKKAKVERNPDHKDLLDSTKHKTFDPKLPGMKRPLKPIPVFKQNPGEHKRAFYYRIDQTIQSMKKRAQFEDKYKVDVQMDDKGNSKIVDREKDEVELEIEKKRNEKLARKGIVRKTKEEKRQARREREKKRKGKGNNGEHLDFNHLQDNVEFGETVHAPPSLNFKNFKKNSSSKPAAEGKGDLILNNKKGGVSKKKVKLSMAQKVLTEKNRQHVVELYRQMKAEKSQS